LIVAIAYDSGLPNWLTVPFLDASEALPPFDAKMADEEQSLIRNHGITYSDVAHALNFRRFSPDSQSILEVGGDLPDILVELMGIQRWTSIVSEQYDKAWHDSFRPRKKIQIGSCSFKIGGESDRKIITTTIGLEDYYNLWHAMKSGQYDAVYSVAALEHIFFLDEALFQISEMLVESGKFYASFSPIWSATNGHHWGREPIKAEAYEHLGTDYTAFSRKLISYGVEPREARMHAFSMFKDMRINRLAFSDYLDIFQDAPFSIKESVPHRQGELRSDDEILTVGEGFTLYWSK